MVNYWEDLVVGTNRENSVGNNREGCVGGESFGVKWRSGIIFAAGRARRCALLGIERFVFMI